MTRPLWWEGAHGTGNAPGGAQPAPPAAADVVIVGGGFTGLWTAYYLLGRDPSLSVVVLEAEHVGFGASGRNGGWVSALWPVGADSVAARHGATAARAMQAALRETVVEVGRVVEQEGIDCGFVAGGTLSLARSPAQAERARAAARAGAVWGDGTVWLEREAALERLAATHVHGATFSPHCARVHPRRLVEGLARAVRERGATIVEGARVSAVGAGVVRLENGSRVRARHVVRATEAWTARLPGLRRRIAPVYSLMVATEPLPPAVWARLGLERRETFSDHRHVVIYGQRTDDDRIAFGGRGAPYHWASSIRPGFDSAPTVFDTLRHTLREMLPQIGDAAFTHEWGGPLGIARDWSPVVGYDRRSAVGWAGGYVGDGVAASNLAGRTLADLVTDRPSRLTSLPWVGHHPPDWEPEPLRWLGINAGLRVAVLADSEERLTGRPARLGRALAALTAH